MHGIVNASSDTRQPREKEREEKNSSTERLIGQGNRATKIQQDERRTSQEFRMTSNLGYRAKAWVSQDIEGWRSRRWDGLGEDDPLEIIGALDGIHLLLVEAVRRL